MQKGTNDLVVEFADDVKPDMLMQLDGVESVRNLEGFRYQLRSKAGVDIRPAVARLAAQHNIGLIELKLLKNSLESIFSQLTTEQPKAE